jgi:hypothetical protein
VNEREKGIIWERRRQAQNITLQRKGWEEFLAKCSISEISETGSWPKPKNEIQVELREQDARERQRWRFLGKSSYIFLHTHLSIFVQFI